MLLRQGLSKDFHPAFFIELMTSRERVKKMKQHSASALKSGTNCVLNEIYVKKEE